MINWSKKLLYPLLTKKIKPVIGYNLLVGFRSVFGLSIYDGVCLYVKGKHFNILNNNLVMRRKYGKTVFFSQLPLYLGGVYYYNIYGYSYGGNVVCSRLTKKRYFKY